MGSDALGLLNAWDIRQSTGPHPHPALCAHLICLPEKHLCSSAQRNCTRGICQKHPFRDYLFLDDPNAGWVFWGVGGVHTHRKLEADIFNFLLYYLLFIYTTSTKVAVNDISICQPVFSLCLFEFFLDLIEHYT